MGWGGVTQWPLTGQRPCRKGARPIRGIDILQQAFGSVKVVWRNGEKALLHAPHREDKKPSFMVYKARNGNYRVKDYATGEDEWLDTFIEKHTGRKLPAERRSEAAERPAETTQRVDSPPLDEMLAAATTHGETYYGHGFDKLGGAEDVWVLTRDIHKRARRGSVVIAWRDQSGDIHGLQVRTQNPHSKMRYWWLVPPVLKLGFSPDYQNADEIVVAEGMFKAQAAARLFQHNYAKRKYKRRVGYIALVNADAVAEATTVINSMPRTVNVLLDSDVHDAIYRYSEKKENRHRAGRWLQFISALLISGRHVRLIRQAKMDVNDTLTTVGAGVAFERLLAGRLERLPKLPQSGLAHIVIPNNKPETFNAPYRAAWLSGAKLGWSPKRRRHYLTMPANFRAAMLATGASRRDVIELWKGAETEGYLTRANGYWTLWLDSTRSIVELLSYGYIEVNKSNTLKRAVLHGSNRKKYGSWTTKRLYAWWLVYSGVPVRTVAATVGFARSTVYAIWKRGWEFLEGDRLTKLIRRTTDAFMRYLEERRERWETLLTPAYTDRARRNRALAIRGIRRWIGIMSAWNSTTGEPFVRRSLLTTQLAASFAPHLTYSDLEWYGSAWR